MHSLNTPKSNHTLLSDQIIRMEINEGEIIEAQDMAKMHKMNIELSKGRSFAVLLDARTHFTVTKEARELLASEEFASHHIASAFVVRSLSAKLTGNFFIKFNRPKNPTELFSDEKKALTWLKEIIRKKELK